MLHCKYLLFYWYSIFFIVVYKLPFKDDKKSSADPSEFKDDDRCDSLESEESDSPICESPHHVYAKSNAVKGQLKYHHLLASFASFVEQIQCKGNKQAGKQQKKKMTK